MKIIAVTTAFFPDEKLVLKNWERIERDVSKYIIVDNSESYTYSLLKSNHNFEIIYRDNGGVSAGLNLGINRAIKMGADYIILFDQDSLSEEGLVAKLLKTPNIDSGRVIVAPNILDNGTGEVVHKSFFKKGKHLKDGYLKVNRTQMSGLLVPKAAFLDSGLMNEGYFLNYVDTEWCLRTYLLGYELLIDTNSFLFHDFGSGEKKILSFSFRYGQPFRGYYNARDALFLMNEQYLSIKLRCRLFLSFLWGLSQILFLDQKKTRIIFYLMGIFDYVKGIRGKGRGI